ncbi:DUF6585 family protein [Streptomyces sp. NPDC051561]|uniref:DUF6585 family protein n=1 Tax=Streptomyces sp. NPDC051561 TaxID=3365658 RepID=UPI00378E5FFB
MAKPLPTSQPPSARSTALAQQAGLGEWKGYTYSPPQGLGHGRFRDWRLTLYVGGVTVTGGDEGYEGAFGWRDTRVLSYHRTLNGGLTDARYTLLDPRGDGVNIGPGINAIPRSTRQMIGFEDVVNGAAFYYPNDWGTYLDTCITQVQLPLDAARLQRGETLDFGEFKLGPNGIITRKRRATWAEVAKVTTYDGRVNFDNARGRSAIDPEMIAHIPNFKVFYSLCHHMSGSASG